VCQRFGGICPRLFCFVLLNHFLFFLMVSLSPSSLRPVHSHTFLARARAHAHTRTRAHAHTRTHAHPHTHTSAQAHKRTSAHAHTHTRTHAHTHTRTHAHTHTRTHAHTHTHARTHTRTHAQTHARTHTHTRTHIQGCDVRRGAVSSVLVQRTRYASRSHFSLVGLFLGLFWCNCLGMLVGLYCS